MPLAFDWTQLAQQTVIGLSSGGTWALLALALVLIYRSTGVVNFAQGEMAMFSTFIAWSLVDHGLSYWTAFALTIAISFGGGFAVERVVIRPVERAPVLTVVIVTIGLFFVFNGAARWHWSTETRTLPNAFSTRPIHVAGVAFSIQDLGNIAVSLGMVVLLWLLFRFTKLGLALRAAAVNPDESIRVSWMLAIGWGLAAAMGGVAGMLAAPALASFDQTFMQPVLLYAFAGAVLGGLDSPLGAVVGSLLLGVFINLIGNYVGWVGNVLKLPVALAVILGVLLVRPEGIFGRPRVRKV